MTDQTVKSILAYARDLPIGANVAGKTKSGKRYDIERTKRDSDASLVERVQCITDRLGDGELTELCIAFERALGIAPKKTVVPIPAPQVIASPASTEPPEKERATQHASRLPGTTQIPVSSIDRWPDQPRRYFNRTTIEQLRQSLWEDGQEIPIQVTVLSDTPAGRYVLVAGERRWRAQSLNQKMRRDQVITLDVLIVTVKDVAEHFERSVLENVQREDMHPLDVASSIVRMRSAGRSTASIARLMGKSVSYVDNLRRLDTLPDLLKQRLHPDTPIAEQMGLTQLVLIAAKTEDQRERVKLADIVFKLKMSVAETRILLEKQGTAPGYRSTSHHDGMRVRKRTDYRLIKSSLGNVRRLVRTLNSIDLHGAYGTQSMMHDHLKMDVKDVELVMSELTAFHDKLAKLRDDGLT